MFLYSSFDNKYFHRKLLAQAMIDGFAQAIADDFMTYLKSVEGKVGDTTWNYIKSVHAYLTLIGLWRVVDPIPIRKQLIACIPI